MKPVFIIIGGGAAGFFCAVNAARIYPGMKVIILEKSNKLLSKVRVSGGGRCNVTHACYSIPDMSAHYPRGASFLKKAFHHFFTHHTIEWFRERGIQLKTEPDGRMFPVTDQSETIIRCLLDEAATYGVEIRMNAEVTGISCPQSPQGEYKISLSNGQELAAARVCLTVGGYPRQGQYQWLSDVGLKIVPPVPSLFTFNMPGNKITGLMGVSVPQVQIKLAGTRLVSTGPLLITHWGMSGPAVLKLSSLAARDMADRNYRCRVVLNWLPDYNENSLLEECRRLRFSIASQKIFNRNPFGLPSRLWEYLLQEAGVGPDTRWADLPAKEQNRLARLVCAGEFDIAGKTTFKEEFVTAGGISLDEVDPSSMQSKKHPGLFFAGEILDIDGVTGGFNFQNAWTTGWISATSAGKGLFNEDKASMEA